MICHITHWAQYDNQMQIFQCMQLEIIWYIAESTDMIDCLCFFNLDYMQIITYENNSNIASMIEIEMVFFKNILRISLTHWGPGEMNNISQMTFSNIFSSMKMFELRLKFHWSLFPRVQLPIFQHWFGKWLGADQAPSHYLNQWWLGYRCIYASLGLNELRIMICHAALQWLWQGMDQRFNSLWSSDAIWRQRSGSTLAQVMACCLMAPSHYLNQCWPIISEVQWHSYKGNFTRDA